MDLTLDLDLGTRPVTDQSFPDIESRIVHMKIDKMCFHSVTLSKIVGTVKLGMLELRTR